MAYDPSTATGDALSRIEPGTRTVLVTGGAVRVGRAICRAFAAQGYDIVLTYRSSSDEAVRAQRELMRFNVRCDIHRLDLDNIDQTTAFAEQMAIDLPHLDVLVHNASIYQQTPLYELTPDQALRHYRINALSPLILSQRLAGRLSESSAPGGGSIVMMLDIHTEGLPRRQFAAYAMSKAALGQAMRTLARELAPRVRVNGVAPGVVLWPEHGSEADKDMQDRYLKSVPMNRSGSPEEAAQAVLWLATLGTYCTGQIIRVDGGRSLI